MDIESKIKSGTSIFAVMSALAAEHKAINLSQGFPDFVVDADLIELVSHFMKAGFNQYPPMPGVAPIREKISELTNSIYGRKYNPDSEITVTSGATESLFAAITSVVKTGDEVIIFEPAYDSYAPAVTLNGGVPVYVQLTFPEYSVDWNKVKDAITDKTKLIIINTPHNPTGSVLNADDMKNLSEITSGKNIFILGDEVYEHIVFDGKRHESVIRYDELAEKSFVISSFGKTFHITGWKVGFTQAPAGMTKAFRDIHQYITFATSAPFQYAIAKYLENPDKVTGLKNMYEEKRDYFLSLVSSSRFKPLKSKGTYFQLLDYSEITKEPDTDFAIRMTKEFGLASIPVSVFYNKKTDNRILRFCFAKNNDTLEKAAEVLCRI